MSARNTSAHTSPENIASTIAFPSIYPCSGGYSDAAVAPITGGMSTPAPAVLVQLALGVFPPLPAIVEVLSEDGGGYALRIVACEEGLLHAFAPRTPARKD